MKEGKEEEREEGGQRGSAEGSKRRPSWKENEKGPEAGGEKGWVGSARGREEIWVIALPSRVLRPVDVLPSSASSTTFLSLPFARVRSSTNGEQEDFRLTSFDVSRED